MTEITSNAGALTEAEIASQPEMWHRALTDPALPVDAMPAADDRVLVLGCGTSYYIGEAWSHVRMAAGGARTRAAIPSELSWVEPDETILVLSRSGTTADVEQVARRLAPDHRIIGVVGVAGSPIDRCCDVSAQLTFADEQSVVQTRFATTALAFLRRVAGEDTSALVAQAEEALASPLTLDGHDHLVFLGSGLGAGLAQEAALKCREAAGAWAEAYPVREYQHGPIAAADERTLVWSLSPIDEGLRAAVQATGAALHESRLDPMAELIRAQRAAVALARTAGRDPDHPAHLSRSVTDG